MQAVCGARWSRSLKGWTIPDTEENRNQCKLPLQHAPALMPPQPAVQTHQPLGMKGKAALLYLSQNNNEQMQKFLQHLQLKAYSQSTIRTYRNEFAQLLQLLANVPVQNLQAQNIQRYLLYCIKKGFSENTIHSQMNALKFYYEQVLHKEKIFFEIPRPKRPLLLPKILNEAELKRMFSAVSNIKHKAILFTAYSAGLRVSETVCLRVQDIDSKRMQIFVRRAKGKKDRVVNLSILVLDVLRQYKAAESKTGKLFIHRARWQRAVQ